MYEEVRHGLNQPIVSRTAITVLAACAVVTFSQGFLKTYWRPIAPEHPPTETAILDAPEAPPAEPPPALQVAEAPPAPPDARSNQTGVRRAEEALAAPDANTFAQDAAAGGTEVAEPVAVATPFGADVAPVLEPPALPEQGEALDQEQAPIQ